MLHNQVSSALKNHLQRTASQEAVLFYEMQHFSDEKGPS
jgi:hypothetical protein